MRKVNVPVMGHLLFLFMTIECSRSVHSIILYLLKVFIKPDKFPKCFGRFCRCFIGKTDLTLMDWDAKRNLH